MGESTNSKRAPLDARIAFWFAVVGFILLPFGVAPIALEDYYGISIGELVPSLRFFPEAIYKYFLLFALLGFTGGLILGLAGLALSIVSRSRSGTILSIISIIGFLFMLVVLKGVPGYTRFHSRIKQQEAKEVLRNIYQAEQDYFKQNGRYAKTFSDLKLTDLGNQRYVFFLSASEVIQPKGINKPYSLPQEYQAFVYDDRFQIVAIGNTNLNPEHDVWQINEKRKLSNLFDDVKGAPAIDYTAH